MNTPNLEDLAVRVEQASGPDRGVDADIELAIGNWSEQHHEAWWHYEAAGESANPPLHQPAPPQCFTKSLDAAMTLVPEGLRLQLSEWDDEVDLRPKGPWQAILTRPGAGSSFAEMNGVGRCEHAATPALALTAAALRARSEYKGGEG